MSKIIQLLARMGESSVFSDNGIDKVIEENELSLEEQQELRDLISRDSKFAAIFLPAKDDEDEDEGDAEDDSDDENEDSPSQSVVNG